MKHESLADQALRQKGHGELSLVAETEFLPAVTGSKLCIAHFYSDEFFRCKVMNKHLRELARRKEHFETRFIMVEAPKAPFFVARLAVQVLPTVLMFIDGKVVDRLTGFADIVEGKETDEFSTDALEKRLSYSGVIRGKENRVVVEKKSGIRTSAITDDGSDLDD